MSYGGESSSKKLARLDLWKIVAEVKALEKKRSHIVLSSSEAGDVACLRALGVAPRNIVAVDIDPVAIDQARSKHAEVDFRIGDVGDVVPRLSRQRRWGSAFLDFCGPISRTTVKTCVRVAGSMPLGSVFAAAFLRGRDRSQPPTPILRLSRKDRRAEAKRRVGAGDWGVRMRRMLLGEEPFDPRCILAEMTRLPVGFRSLTAGERRSYLLSGFISNACRIKLWRLVTIEYQGAGVPMVICAYTIDRPPPGGYRGRIAINPDEADQRVKAAVIREFDGDTVRASLGLNVHQARVRAWKAHCTMGSYSVA